MNHGPYIPHLFGDSVTSLYQEHRGWLTAAVHCSIAWPERDVLVNFDGDDYFLRGLKQAEDFSAAPCISMRCCKDEVHAILKKIYRFASILGWYQQGYVDVVGYSLGSHPILYAAGKQPFMSMMASDLSKFNCNYMPLIRDDLTRRALAFWREGRRLIHVHDGYAFLSFYKVIESQFKKANAKVDWINRAIPTLGNKAGERVQELHAQGLDVGRHIFDSGRCAIAHASFDEERGDPDIPEDRIRISKDLSIVEALAKKYIAEVLDVPNEFVVYDQRNRFLPLHAYIAQSHVDELSRGGSVLRRKLGLNGLTVAVNWWPSPAPGPFQNLKLTVISAHNGIVVLRASNDELKIDLVFILDFLEGKAHTDIENSEFLDPASGGTLQGAITVLEYQKAVIGNKIIEVCLPNGEKFDCEVVIPVNIDIGRTYETIDMRVAQLMEEFGSM